MLNTLNRFLLIDYDPYDFLYGQQDVNYDFDSYLVWESFDRVALPYPMNIKMQIQDVNKLHFNLDGADNIQLSKPMLIINMIWESMEDTFRPGIDRLLDVSRLKSRLSFNSGKDYLFGEFKTEIKKEDLTGYNIKHLDKVNILFATKLESNILDKFKL